MGELKKCRFDDCENQTTNFYWCGQCYPKAKDALISWQVAGCPVVGNDFCQEVEYYNRVLRDKKIPKKIPSIKCKYCDAARLRGSKECEKTDSIHLGAKECDVIGCVEEIHTTRCKAHHKEWCESTLPYDDFMSQFESEEDYQKSKDAAKKKEEHMPVTTNLDAEQLNKLGKVFRMEFAPSEWIPPKEEPTPRDEHKHAESCGQMSLEQVQAVIDNQAQEEVDARREAHNISKSYEVECIETTQEVTMSKTNINTLPILKEDATDAGWRIAGRQFTKLTRDPIVAAIARGLGDDSEAMRAKVAAFLKTELGTAIYQGMLSTGLSFMPQATGDIPQRMARELRTEAMAIAGDQVADLLMEPLRQVASMYLASMPQEVPALEQDTTSVKAEVTIPVSVEAKR